MLAYTDFTKKRIAFSASFGKDDYDEVTDEQKYLVNKWLNRFDGISTRELSGVDICKNEFNINAEHIIDPVFLLDKSYWNKLSEDEELSNKYKDKIVSYVLDENVEIDNACEYLQKSFNTELKQIANQEIEVEEFLTAIKNCRYFITDSFHGVCFALIFKKPFICLINQARGGSRFKSLIDLFGIDNLFIFNIKEIYNKTDLFEEYNIENYENIINEYREKAKLFVNNILNNDNKTNKQIINELDILNLNKSEFKDNFISRKSTIKYTMLERIFSVKNIYLKSKKFKVLTILGIKIKFGRKHNVKN
jgi:hypothetical protein